MVFLSFSVDLGGFFIVLVVVVMVWGFFVYFNLFGVFLFVLAQVFFLLSIQKQYMAKYHYQLCLFSFLKKKYKGTILCIIFE